MVSIIVVTYNHENYIAQCLDSILNQCIDESIEVIVSDDASTDKTVDIISKFKKRYASTIKPTYRITNVGATRNLLEALYQATGDYIAFCDGDDYWIDTYKLKKQIKFLKNNDKYIGCVNKILVVGDEGNPLSVQNVSWINDSKSYSLKDYDCIKLPGHLSSLCFKKTILISRYFIDELFIHPQVGDKFIFLLTLSQGNIKFMPDEMSVYRLTRNKISNNFVAKLYGDNVSWVIDDLKIVMAMQKWLLKHKSIKKLFIKYKSQLFLTLLFQKLKGYETASILTFFSYCENKSLVILRMPIAVVEQAINKIKLILGYSIR